MFKPCQCAHTCRCMHTNRPVALSTGFDEYLCHVAHNGRYMHTKGVGAGTQSESGRRNVYVWRFMMEYFLIARWRECQRLLEDYDVVGALATALLSTACPCMAFAADTQCPDSQKLCPPA